MTESIEIHSYPTKYDNSDDIQEYCEIVEETTFYNNTTSSRKDTVIHNENPNEYDFFTNNGVKAQKKCTKKGKKSKKKEKSATLMDFINSEIAASQPPTTRNIIAIVDHSTKQRRSLTKNSQTLEIFRKHNFFHSKSIHNSHTVNLSPIFPNVLENTTRDSNEIQVECVEPTVYNTLIKSCKSLPPGNDLTTLLDLSIKNLKFYHHQRFSLEHLLFNKLRELYYEYEITNRTITDLFREITVSRETKKSIKDNLLKINPSKEESLRFDPVVRKYTGKLLQLKEAYINTLTMKKGLILNIKSLWCDIQMVRMKSKCTQTHFSLHINDKQCNHNELEKQWLNLYSLEFMDELDKIEYDYVSKYIEYKEKKLEQKQEESTRKRVIKPKLTIDEESLSEKVEQIVNDITSSNNIEIILKQEESKIVYPVELNVNLFEYIYRFEIYVDDIFVCKSNNYRTEKENFEFDFIETFTIQIIPNNKIISIVLIENDETESKVEIDLVKIKKKSNDADFIKQSFSFKAKIKPTSEFVGSGYTIKDIAMANKVRLKCCGMFKSYLFTTGEVCMQLKWNVKVTEIFTQQIKSTVEIGTQIKRLLQGIDKPNLDTLRDLIKYLFSKDVNEDKIMLNALINLCKTEIRVDDTFPIDVNGPDFIRFKLIQARNIRGIASLENSMIPLNSSEITMEQLNFSEKSFDKDFDINYLTKNDIDLDPIELQRFIGAKYVERLNSNILKNVNNGLLQKTYRDVVRDFNSFSLRELLTLPNNLTPGLVSNFTKQQILRESCDQPQEIYVTVLRAFNLIDRNCDQFEDIEDSYRIAGFKMNSLRPFVRINYRGISAQTASGIGCHPCWNHTLKIITKLSPLSALHINIFDEYKVNVTEECAEDNHSNRTVQYRFYNRWLGTLEVPMYNVLALGTLRGTFKITTSPIILGYANPQRTISTSVVPEISQLMKKEISFVALHITTNLSHLGRLQQYKQPTNPSDDGLIKHLNKFTTQYTNDFPFRSILLTFVDSDGNNKCVTQFLRAIPPPKSDYFPKNPKSCESAISKSSELSRSSTSKSSERKEIDLEKGEQIVERHTEYKSSGRSGDVILKSIHACTRYVALIPSYEVTESHAITLTGLELLKILHGSPLDHTILLASYFLYLEIKCWVVIGLGLPRGPSSYVLIKYDLGTNRIVLIHDQPRRGFFDKNEGCIWYVFDSISGERFELREVGCPLKTVDYVFDSENIWVNIQPSQDCDTMSFDFNRSSDWRPVFEKLAFLPKPIPNESSLYSDPQDVKVLRNILEAKIKAKVQKWRAHVKTIWNRYCGTLLRENLPQWEYWAFNPLEPKPGLGQRFKQLMITHKMFGFPLNVPFTSAKAVISRVKSTCLHHNNDPNVEFAIGVELYPYPNNVVSVWVYLVTISKI